MTQWNQATNNQQTMHFQYNLSGINSRTNNNTFMNTYSWKTSEKSVRMLTLKRLSDRLDLFQLLKGNQGTLDSVFD